MSTQVPNWWVPQIVDGIIHAVQSKGFTLRNTTRRPSRVQSNQAQFNTIGKGTATKANRADNAVPMNLSKDKVLATIEDYEAFEEIWHHDLAKMTAVEMDEAKTAGGMALGRKFDEIIMDAVKADALTSTGYVTKESTVAGMKLELAIAACVQLQKRQAFMPGEMYCPMPALAFNQLCAYKQFNSADYTGPDLAYVTGAMRRSWNGVHWFVAPEELFTVHDTNQFDFYLWHREGVGWADNGAADVNAKVVPMEKKIGWMLQMWMGGAAKVIQADRIQKITTTNDSAVTLA